MNAKEILGRRLMRARRRVWRVLQSASTSHKLALAFALFLIPVSFVASKLAEEQQHAVDIARQERDGAFYLRVVNEAHALLNMQARAQEIGHGEIDNITGAVRA